MPGHGRRYTQPRRSADIDMPRWAIERGFAELSDDALLTPLCSLTTMLGLEHFRGGARCSYDHALPIFRSSPLPFIDALSILQPARDRAQSRYAPALTISR